MRLLMLQLVQLAVQPLTSICLEMHCLGRKWIQCSLCRDSSPYKWTCRLSSSSKDKPLLLTIVFSQVLKGEATFSHLKSASNFVTTISFVQSTVLSAVVLFLPTKSPHFQAMAMVNITTMCTQTWGENPSSPCLTSSSHLGTLLNAPTAITWAETGQEIYQKYAP